MDTRDTKAWLDWSGETCDDTDNGEIGCRVNTDGIPEAYVRTPHGDVAIPDSQIACELSEADLSLVRIGMEGTPTDAEGADLDILTAEHIRSVLDETPCDVNCEDWEE